MLSFFPRDVLDETLDLIESVLGVFLPTLINEGLISKCILIWSPPVIFIAAVPRRLFCFDSLVILDVARCYLWLFTLYINIKIGKNSY